ncbi:UbiH/UbiF/VisC/COQ6 family ubiquinone biosynthesis hydroxylase [Neptuniibacter marinus]|uniref:UbiH/UbiF/VisC/COQ6 family ubiquinone biosynthesis hydroxylase n=1 Tax=Neptuniibacter marinus TaxID=1806670 RepID=UPI0008369839|nr:UbiH/UbiF/VisC/COQ6 family ubiquinone biosynthesis hydroxylase [Neptuniibacter marinus]
MSEQIQVDVVIVGAGMVGLTLAAGLASNDLNILILEQRIDSLLDIDAVLHAQTQGFDPRVSALTCASQQILTAVGAWQYMQDCRISPYEFMDVWDGEGTGHIHFSAQDLHEPVLGHIVENRVTLAALHKVIKQANNIELELGVSVVELSNSEDGCRSISLDDGRVIKASLVVAADGALSKTRQMAGIPMWEWDYGHDAIVTTVKTEKQHGETAWQRFTEDGPLAFLPLSSDDRENYCSIVWSTSPLHAKTLMALDDKDFCVELELAFEQRLGQILSVDKRFSFPLKQRHAKRYVEQNFAAIGDAAHTIHPLAGQGVNLGLMDAAQLVDTLLEAKNRDESIGSENVLKRFQRARRTENLQMSAAMEGFKRLFDNKQPLLRLARNMGMNLLDQLAPIKNHIVQDAMGLSGNLPTLAKRPIKE